MAGLTLNRLSMVGFIKLIWIAAMFAVLTGCKAGEAQPLTDEITEPDIHEIAMKKGYLAYHHNYDNMDRGHHDFEAQTTIIDPEYYEDNPLKRGEIVYFINPDFDHDRYSNVHLEEMSISRVVALPGETIKIKAGQIYVNDRKLNSFYGHAHRIGSDISALKKSLEEKGDTLSAEMKQNIENMIRTMESEQLGPVKIPDGDVFVVGDDWFRSFDSRHFGSLPAKMIQGKVLGYLENTSS
ncbi:signal peptidase I [Paenibacillus dokdonensis]|uniref:Signal peptidase I n=1 Tax=Paenibacillus dokdonensis TaxID=2567944 RepID=A0ABU6GKR4_9BACL|nr:signal peptidase I [Paenibacillus dokdonensis]MEC0240334.1 signal peptidase I [Paenibacillus dokdonensis]